MPVLPKPDAFTEPFWAGLRDGNLLVPECGDCKSRFFVPEPLCPRCGSSAWTWQESPGVGTVYSLSVVYQGVDPDQPTPYVIAAVDLDDGWTIMTHIIDCDPESVAIGDLVKVTPTRMSDEIVLPTFSPW